MSLENLKRTVESVLPDATVTGFMKPNEALEHARVLKVSETGNIDLAFLDIEMGGMNGLQLAKSIKDIFNNINIVFSTGHSQYAVDAYAIHASGYLLKPVSADAVVEAMDYLHHPVVPVSKKKLRIQTFGNFEVFANDVPLTFARTKSKELLAYLVMRNGARCSNNEIVAVLWENKPDSTALQNQYRHLVLDLKKSLQSVGAGDILIKQRGAMAILPDKIACDLYDYYKGDIHAVNNYRGEFMAQYSWAELSNAYLENRK